MRNPHGLKKTDIFWPAGYDGSFYNATLDSLKQLFYGEFGEHYFFDYLESGKIIENKYVSRYYSNHIGVFEFSKVTHYYFTDYKIYPGGIFFDLVKDIFEVESHYYLDHQNEGYARASYPAQQLKYFYIRVVNEDCNPMLPTYNAHYESDGDVHLYDIEFQSFGGYNLAIKKLDINKKPLDDHTYIYPEYIIPEVVNTETIDFNLSVEVGAVYTDTVNYDFDWEKRKIIIVLSEVQYHDTAQIWIKGGFHTNASFCDFVASAKLHNEAPYPESMTINSQTGDENVLEFNVFPIISEISELSNGIRVECNFPGFVESEDETIINIETKLIVATVSRVMAHNLSNFREPYEYSWQNTSLNMSFSQDINSTSVSGFANIGNFEGFLDTTILNSPQPLLSVSESESFLKQMIYPLGYYPGAWEPGDWLDYYTTPRVWNNNYWNIDYDSLSVEAIQYYAFPLTKGVHYTFNSSTSEFHYLSSNYLDYGIRAGFRYSVRAGCPIAVHQLVEVPFSFSFLFYHPRPHIFARQDDVYLEFYALNQNFPPLTWSYTSPRYSRLTDYISNNVDIHSGIAASEFSFTFHNLKTDSDYRIIGLTAPSVYFYNFGGGGNSFSNDTRDPYNPEKRGPVFYDGNSLAVTIIGPKLPRYSSFEVETLEVVQDKILFTIPKKHVKAPLGRLSTQKEDYSISLEYDIIPMPIAAPAYTELLGNVKFDNVKLITKNNNSGTEIIQNVSNPVHAYILCQLPKDREYSFFGMKGKLFLFFAAHELYNSNGDLWYIVNIMAKNFDPVTYMPTSSWHDILGTVHNNKTYLFTTGVSVFCVEDNSNTFVQLGEDDYTYNYICWCGVLNEFLTFLTPTAVGVLINNEWHFKSFYDEVSLSSLGTLAHIHNTNFISGFGYLYNNNTEFWDGYYLKMYIKVSVETKTIDVEFVKNQNIDNVWDVSGIYDESCFYVKT